MQDFKHPTPKRTLLVGNITGLAQLQPVGKKRVRKAAFRTSIKYKNREGKTCWKGSPKLKSTQTLGQQKKQFWEALLMSYECKSIIDYSQDISCLLIAICQCSFYYGASTINQLQDLYTTICKSSTTNVTLHGISTSHLGQSSGLANCVSVSFTTMYNNIPWQCYKSSFMCLDWTPCLLSWISSVYHFRVRWRKNSTYSAIW